MSSAWKNIQEDKSILDKRDTGYYITHMRHYTLTNTRKESENSYKVSFHRLKFLGIVI